MPPPDTPLPAQLTGSTGASAPAPIDATRATQVGAVKGRSNVGPIAGRKPMALEEYPRPVADNGWGMHWIPTVSSTPEVVDRFVREAQEMGIKWMVILNEGTQIGANDYLVSKLVQSGIMPVMRVYTPGLAPIMGDLEALVRHYKQLGVSYFQLYNEPNLRLENDGADPDVNRYLDVWIAAAKRVVAAGGLPGFRGAQPAGARWTTAVSSTQALRGLKERGEEWLLDRGWLSMHNYAGNLPLDNPDGFALPAVRRHPAARVGAHHPHCGHRSGHLCGTSRSTKPSRSTSYRGAYRYGDPGRALHVRLYLLDSRQPDGRRP